jgi:hypothetical protein
MSATEADVAAATTAAAAEVPDGKQPEPTQGAESAPAVTNTDEESSKVLDPVQKRIDELTRRRYDAERERDYWREHAQRAPRQEAPPPPAPEPQATGKTLADFAYDESKYQAYLFQQARADAVKAAEEVLSRKQTETARFQTVTAHKEREAEFAKKVPDYFEVAHYAPITDSMAEIVMESEMSAELAYHLGKNRQVALNLSRLTPLQQAREIGRIEAKLAAKPTPPATSNAPPPAPKIGGASDAGTGAKPDAPDSDKLSDAEWTRRRNQQVAKRRGT